MPRVALVQNKTRDLLKRWHDYFTKVISIPRMVQRDACEHIHDRETVMQNKGQGNLGGFRSLSENPFFTANFPQFVPVIPQFIHAIVAGSFSTKHLCSVNL
jgi:hypothetical protein